MHWRRLVLIILLAGLATGCGALKWSPWGKASRDESLKKMDPVRIQADTMGFADRFVTGMTGVFDEVERRATSPAAKDTAHRLKTDLALGSISNAVNPRPIAGMIDMVVFVTLFRQITQDPWAREMFGADASRLAESLTLQEADVRSMAKRYLTDAQLAEISSLADRWHREHPDQRSVAHVHLADLPEANRPPEKEGTPPTSVFGLLFLDPTANLDPAVREVELSRATSERMFFYLQRMPLLLQLQAEAFYRQMLEAPEVNRGLDDMSALAGSVKRFSEVSGRFTDTIARFPQQLSQERQEAIAQLDAQVAKQRDAAIGHMAEALAVQREAAITQATTQIASQREQAIQQLAAATRQEQKAFVDNLEAATDRSINRLLKRMTILALVLLALIAGTAFAYRRLSR